MTRDNFARFTRDIKDALDRFKSDIIRCWIAALTVQTVVIIGVFALAFRCGL